MAVRSLRSAPFAQVHRICAYFFARVFARGERMMVEIIPEYIDAMYSIPSRFIFKQATLMKILGALGLGLTIIMLKWLMTDTFVSFEHFLIAFFSFGESAFQSGGQGAFLAPELSL